MGYLPDPDRMDRRPGTGIELRNNVAGTAYDGVNYIELDTTANSIATQVIGTTNGQITIWLLPIHHVKVFSRTRMALKFSGMAFR